MILWILLFGLVLAISFVLALKSMRDYQEVPSGENGLFLIRQSMGFEEFLTLGVNISLERLFRGNKVALVVFGPKDALLKYKDKFNLLELEDYTDVSVDDISAWEVGVKESGHVFNNLPELLDTEQFWWQINTYHIRAILIAKDPLRRKDLTQKLQNMAPEIVFKLPKAFSNVQLLDFYKKRSFQKSENLSLSAQSFWKLISL